MEQLLIVLGTTALLGSALIGGVFFAFSSFVMKALALAPPAEGIACMQRINVVVLNRSFLGAFLGTAVLSLLTIGFAWTEASQASMPFFVAAALLYLLGTFVVTVLGNVPLNDRLAAQSAEDIEANKLWRLYLVRWTRLNHIRTAAALASALLYSVGLTKFAGR